LQVVMGAAGRSLKSQMRQASGINARFALILGAGEISDGTVTVRDLTTSEQSRLPAAEVLAKLTQV
jgi:histidyl-tRNA synthetase